MLRAEVGRQGRLDVSSWYSLFSHNLEAATAKPSSGWTNAAPVRVCGARPSTVPLQLRILKDILGCRAYWSQHLLAATLMLLFQICYSQPLAQGKVGEEPGPKRTGLNLDVGRVWGPKTEPESGTQKVCPHFFRPLFLSRSQVPKMGPQNRPLAQPRCAKCPGLTDPHLVAYPCAAAIAAATGQPIYWRTLRPILAEALSPKLVQAGSCVCPQPALPLVAASPCVRERLGL